MKKFACTICAAAMLAACGERGASPQTGEKPGPDVTQSRADLEAEHDKVSADIAQAARKRGDVAAEEGSGDRLLEYKRVLLPLIAHDFTGRCSAKSGPVEGAAIKLARNGAVSASGMKERNFMDEEGKLTVSSVSEAGRSASMGFSMVGAHDQWGMIKAVGKSSAVYTESGDALECADRSRAMAARDSALYPSVARFFMDGGETLHCSNSGSAPKSYRISVTESELVVGGDSFALESDNAEETVIVDDADRSLTYSRQTSGNRVTMKLDRTGKLTSVNANGAGLKRPYICAPGQR